MNDPTPDGILGAVAGDLVFVEFGNTDEAAELVDRLNGLDGAVADRFGFERTLGEALLKARRPGAAAASLDAAYELRKDIPPNLRGDLPWLLARAGRRNQARRALAEYCATWNDSAAEFDPLSSDLGAAAMTALWLGDLETLERAVAMPDEWSQTELGNMCLKALHAGGFGELFARHQATVIDCLETDQYWCDVLPDIEDGEDSNLIIMVHFLDADRPACRALEDRLHDRLDGYYGADGWCAGGYLSGYFNHLVSLPAAEGHHGQP